MLDNCLFPLVFPECRVSSGFNLQAQTNHMYVDNDFFFLGHRVFFLRFPPLSIGVKDYGPVEDTGCHCSSVNHDDAHSQNAAVEVPMAPH